MAKWRLLHNRPLQIVKPNDATASLILLYVLSLQTSTLSRLYTEESLPLYLILLNTQLENV